MPGIVVFGRRWSAGSDDMVVPALSLVFAHAVWLTALTIIFTRVEFDLSKKCTEELKDLVLGNIVILGACLLLETIIIWVSQRGSILETKPRVSMQYLLYIRLVVFLGEVTWLVLCMKWIFNHYMDGCTPDSARRTILGNSIFNILMIFFLIICLWCTFDSAGRKWVKMKRYQESMKEKTRRSRRSGSARRNWRQRKAFRAYEESWDRRLGLMCCCVERKGRNKNSMSEIAQLFTEFFRDLDVVPSDVIAGLVLLRRFQKLRMLNTIEQHSNDVYRYLSGIPVTPRTQFVQLSQPEDLQQYKLVIHYMRFAMAAYGWPIFMMMNTGTGLCKMLPYLRCCCCRPCCKGSNPDYVRDDNCCECNLVALKKISGLPDTDLVYVTYHVDIGETPFYVALDNKHKKIVICVRGTLSLQDVLTDLKADAETLPLNPVREDWVGHRVKRDAAMKLMDIALEACEEKTQDCEREEQEIRDCLGPAEEGYINDWSVREEKRLRDTKQKKFRGMVQAAVYIKKKLKEDGILGNAFQKVKERTSEKYDLVLVGHSLGAGTAAILAIMLQQEYQDVHCYAYSPPGGLLSYECVEETKHYITSVVVGKDVVPRIGLPQMELLRTDLINIIKKSTNPKWKIITKALCCGTKSASRMSYEDVREDIERNVTAHPSDEQIGLTAHKPMYPPGRIILVVRNHPNSKKLCCGEKEPVYQAIWADNSDFQEVLISPTMVNDHMPDNVLDALEKVLVNVAPPKPTRTLTEAERKALLNHDMSPDSPDTPESQKHLIIENQTQTLSESAPFIQSNLSNTNNQIHLNHLGWDAVTEELLLSLDRHHLFPGFGEPPHLDMEIGTDWIHAPLASPEILSSASSMTGLSRSSSVARTDTKSDTNVTTRLEPIQQSPDVKMKSDTPVIGSLENVCETDNVSDQGTKVHRTVSAGSSNFLLKPQHYRVLNGSSQDIPNGSMNNLLKYSESQTSRFTLNQEGEGDLQADSVSQVSVSEIDQKPKIKPSSLELISSAVEKLKTNSASEPMEFDKDVINADQKGTLELYDHHSPDESTQYGYGNPNEVYSAACIGYHPQTFAGYHPPIRKTNQMPESNSKTARPNKRLQYSQSESHIEVLSDKFKMKRSTEQGDIAHMGDTTKVFIPEDNRKKKLYQIDSSPQFDYNVLPKPAAMTKLDSVEEHVTSSEFNKEKSADSLDHSNGESSRLNESDEGILVNENGGSLDLCLDDEQEQTEKITNNRKGLILSDCPGITDQDRTNGGRNGSLADSVISPTRQDKFEDLESPLFNSNSYHSTSVSSFSGESDKHLSSVSGQSDISDLPIVETDV